MSTLQSTVAGKADAGTEITGGTFSDGTLTLEKANGDIEIPIIPTGGKQLVTSGDGISDYIVRNENSITVMRDIDVEYIYCQDGALVDAIGQIKKRTYPFDFITTLGGTMLSYGNDTLNQSANITISASEIYAVFSPATSRFKRLPFNPSEIITTHCYRLYI